MPGPFPGFDPFLEGEWEDVHASLVGSVRDQLNVRLPPDLVCRAEKQVMLRSGGGDDLLRRVKPDGYIATGGGGSGAALASSAVLDRAETFEFEPETYVAKWLEIRDRRDREVVTTVEVLSPINKTGEREAFRRKQRELTEGGVSLVEIDLLRRGRWALYPPEEAVPEAFREPYRLASTAVRDGVPKSRFTRVRLREPLPGIPIPLRPDDPPVTLELQPLVEHAWTAGRYGDHYDAPPPPFPPEDAAWIAERVREWTERTGSAVPSPARDGQPPGLAPPPPTGSPDAG